ncbi:hypothetical protein [Streptomyces sp. YIM 121038]|uniref:hypothetical protein n=1 Tax=Streptomyces sp. YIM 121038 TaxID=2136401 RepID=UPI002017FBF2|nr:hypothetical protein [Streptomyces sp. YIM 121038]
MDSEGHFVVVGRIHRTAPDGSVGSPWGAALVHKDTPLPSFGQRLPYRIVRELSTPLSTADHDVILHTLPLPLPCSNAPMVFAPEQLSHPGCVQRPSYPLHQVPIPDLRPADGPKVTEPIVLGQWLRAYGEVRAQLTDRGRKARFSLDLEGLIPDSLYTVMSLRRSNLTPPTPTRPGPLGVPNVFVTDRKGRGTYTAELPDPFPPPDSTSAPDRIINIIILWMSYQQNYGGAIALFGLGADIHAQLKLPDAGFQELVTSAPHRPRP